MRYLQLTTFIFLGLTVALVLFMIGFLIYKKRRHIRYQQWKAVANLLVNSVIFADGDVHLPSKVRTKMKDQVFRRIVAKKIISSSKSLSGQSAENLEQFYLRMGFDRDTLSKVKDIRWQIRTEGIQEVGLMKLKDLAPKIYRHTNSSNEWIRIEAQVALVRTLGFEGLRFLDVVTYPISEWHQIRLMNELNHLPEAYFKGISQWLQSPNLSVITFALKLCRRYHLFLYYDQIVALLSHASEEVRRHAIGTLGIIYTETTAGQLIERFPAESTGNQLLIARVIRNVASPAVLPQLEKFLSASPDNELRMALVRSIAHLLPDLHVLDSLPGAQHYPLNEMIAHVKAEKAA